MDENEVYIPELDDIEQDVALEAINEFRLDLIDFCINQIDVETPFIEELDSGEDKFMVSIKSGLNKVRIAYQP